MKKFVVVLRLALLTITEKFEYARFIVGEMGGNAFFPDPTPPLADVSAAADALEAASLAAVDGPKSETALMYLREHELDILLTYLGSYVQFVSNQDPEQAKTIIFSAGMDVKADRGSVARVFDVRNTVIDGQVFALTDSAKGSAAYIWQYTLTPEVEESWVDAGTTVVSQIIISGLTPGQRYYFRMAVVTSSGQGPWDGPQNMIVT